MKELRVDDVLPFTFPYGIGGPSGKQHTQKSKEDRFQRLFCLSMKNV